MRFFQSTSPAAAFIAGVLLCGCFAIGWSTLFRPAPALAQLPNAGAQRAIMIKELHRANTQLETISKLLTELRDIEKERTARTSEPQRD